MPDREETSSGFYMLAQPVQKWIWRQDWNSLRDIQENSIAPIIAHDTDVIISAATAGGKTEAAFMPIISRLLKEGKKGIGYDVVYISPLKALINDQYNRLTEMTAGTGIEVTAWHGDVNASAKQKSLKDPNGILIITPEALEAFFVNRRQHLQKAFGNLQYIVVDEFHSFIGNERGTQLQSLLMRVENVTRQMVPRIALSATFSDVNVVKDCLRNTQDYPCTIPESGNSDHEIKVLIKEYTESKNYNPQDEMAHDMYEKLRGSNNLVFANSKERVELFASSLSEMCEENFVPNEFRVHHGNMSKSERENVEYELQKGEFPITAVCTSTLELGVDIGKVKSIVQIDTANSVLSLRQRLGRSGRRGEPSILRIYSIDTEGNSAYNLLKTHLVQNIAVVELLKEKRYESANMQSLHLSTLVQQVLSIICQFGGFQIKDDWNFLCKQGVFTNVTPQMFMELIRSLGEAKIVTQTHTGEIIIGVEGEKIVKSHNFYVAFNTFPEYTIINKDNQKIIGTLQYVPHVGEYIIFGGRKWRVCSANKEAKNIFVQQVKFGELPSFESEPVEGDGLIVGKMKEIYESGEALPYLDAAAREELDKARMFFMANGLSFNSFYKYGKEQIFFTWAGIRINRTIALMLTKRDNILRQYTAIGVENATPNMISTILEMPKPTGIELAQLIERRSQKQFNKYDYLLSDNLLDMEYAATKLDVEGTWNFLHNLNSREDEEITNTVNYLSK